MKKIKKILFVLWIICSVFVVFNWRHLENMPFQKEYTYQSVSSVEGGSQGQTYVIDQEKKTLLLLDDQGRIYDRRDGGSLKLDFYYATHVCDDGQGNVYVSDIVYGNHGNCVEKERIIRLEQRKSVVVYEWSYEKMDNPPMQYGLIEQMDFVDGQLRVLLKERNRVSYESIPIRDSVEKDQKKKDPEVLFSRTCAYRIAAATYDPQSDTLAISARTGEVYIGRGSSDHMRQVAKCEEHQIPSDLAIADNNLYYIDAENIAIYKVNMDQFNEAEDVTGELFYQDEENMFLGINARKDGQSLLLTDYECFYVLENLQAPAGQQTLLCVDSSVFSRYLSYTLTWIALFLAIISLIILLVYLLLFLIHCIAKAKSREQILRFIFVLLSCSIVGSTIAGIQLKDMSDEQLEYELKSMTMFAQIMSDHIDGDDISKLADPESYGSELYYRVRKSLDKMVDQSYENEQYYYYCIYALSENGIFLDGIMDYEDTIANSMPGELYGDESLSRVLDTGKIQKERGEGGAYGSWMYVDVPIYNKDGVISAVLEIGSNKDSFNKRLQDTIIQNICATFCNAAVVAMLFMEILFLFAYYEQRKKKEFSAQYDGIPLPLRSLNFLTYSSIGLQDAFVVIMCSALYKNMQGTFLGQAIPSGIGAALPLSVQLFLCSVFSVIGGKLCQKYGPRKIIFTGFLLQFSGFVCCIIQLSYIGVLIALSLVGMGMGLVIVGCNTMAALGNTPEAREKAFSDVAAGCMAGATVGVGLGAMILLFGSYRLVYAIAAILMIGGALLSIGKDKKLSREEIAERLKEEEDEESQGTLWEFLLNRRTIVFLTFVVVPFMMTLSFKDYFFPVYVSQYGFSEVHIGQVHLVCGLCVLYAGPTIAHNLIKRMGSGASIILSMTMILGGFGCFLIFPSVLTAVIAVALVFIAHSFSYTAQFTFFGELPAVIRYGEGSAMGVYSMFESLGETLGPICFGAALGLGDWNGIALIAFVLLACLLIFALFSAAKRKGENK